MPIPNTGPVKDDYLVGSSFMLDIPDVAKIAGLTDVSGLALEVNVVEMQSATKDGKLILIKAPGAAKYSEVTVKRHFTGDKSMWTYMAAMRDGKNAQYRKNGAIIMYGFDGGEVGRWTFSNAFPSKWSLSDLDVNSDDPITEELVLQIELLKRDK